MPLRALLPETTLIRDPFDRTQQRDKPVESAEDKSLGRIALQHIELMPENQDFRFKPRS